MCMCIVIGSASSPTPCTAPPRNGTRSAPFWSLSPLRSKYRKCTAAVERFTLLPVSMIPKVNGHVHKFLCALHNTDSYMAPTQWSLPPASRGLPWAFTAFEPKATLGDVAGNLEMASHDRMRSLETLKDMHTEESQCIHIYIHIYIYIYTGWTWTKPWGKVGFQWEIDLL